MTAEAESIVSRLRDMGTRANVEKKRRRFGITADNAVGVNQKELALMAKAIGFNNDLAFALFETGIYEARLLCSKVYNPKDLTDEHMEYWASTFENWEICDSFCMGLFAKSALAERKAVEWSKREPLFVKRAGFAIMAAYGYAHKSAPDDVFETFLACIRDNATDDRHYVKKAVNWALRSIGKRNPPVNQMATELASELKVHNDRAARWIGADALRELSDPGRKLLNYPRARYGEKR